MCVERTDDHPAIILRREGGVPRATWAGIMTCGHIWTCPVCSQNLRAERAQRVGRAVKYLGGQWVMVTFTVRHHAGLKLKELRDCGMHALRKTRQGGAVQRIWSERVSASVRAQEMPYGDNGWHWHVHLLMRSSDWSEEEKGLLAAKWSRELVRALGPNARPNYEHGVVWSEPFDASNAESADRARYLAKIGLETVGIGKGSKWSLTPWQVAELAADGDKTAQGLWREYFEATRGKRMIEMDDRASAAAEQALLEEQLEAMREDDGKDHEPVRITVERDDVRRLRMLEWRGFEGLFGVLLSAAEQGGRAAVDEWIAYARENVVRNRSGPAPPVQTWGWPGATPAAA